MQSFRKAWTETIVGKTLQDLFNYNGDSASAIIIEETDKNI